MSGGDNTDLGLNHADYIQTWGGLGRGESWGMRLCKMSVGPSNYNGFMLKDDSGENLGPIDVRYVDIDLLEGPVDPDSENGGGWSGLFMRGIDSIHYEPGTVWIDHNEYRNSGELTDNVFPWASTLAQDSLGTYIEWSESWITGRVYSGFPPGGSYVPAGSVGIGYLP